MWHWWTADVIAHVWMLAALSWRGRLWVWPWCAAALAVPVLQYAALAQLPFSSASYFLAFIPCDVLALVASVGAAIEAHRGRMRASGDVGEFGGYAAAVAAVAASGVVLLLWLWGEWSGAASWQVRALQALRFLSRCWIFFFLALSFVLASAVRLAGGSAAAARHHAAVLAWAAVAVVSALGQLSWLGGANGYPVAAALDSLWLLGWSAAVDDARHAPARERQS
jgi:hypothetical protein